MLVTLVQKVKCQDKHVHLMASSHSSVPAGQQSPLGENCFEVSRRDGAVRLHYLDVKDCFRGSPSPRVGDRSETAVQELEGNEICSRDRNEHNSFVKRRILLEGSMYNLKRFLGWQGNRGSRSVLCIYSVTISMPLTHPETITIVFFIAGRQSTIITGNFFFNQKRFNLIKFMTLTWNSQETKNWMENKPNNTMNFM